jgi:hypothetical protein
VSKPEQVSRPVKPALPAAGETSAEAADAAERLSKIAGYRCSYKIPRLISLIRESYLENFQALPEILDGCIIRAPETIQERFLFSVLMEAGMVLSGEKAKNYNKEHFRLQRKKILIFNISFFRSLAPFFIGCKHFSSGAEFGANIFHRPQTFLFRRKVRHEHFS